MSAVVVPMLALGPLQGQDSSAIGPLRTAWRPSRLRAPTGAAVSTQRSGDAASEVLDQEPLRNGDQCPWR